MVTRLIMAQTSSLIYWYTCRSNSISIHVQVHYTDYFNMNAACTTKQLCTSVMDICYCEVSLIGFWNLHITNKHDCCISSFHILHCLVETTWQLLTRQSTTDLFWNPADTSKIECKKRRRKNKIRFLMMIRHWGCVKSSDKS